MDDEQRTPYWGWDVTELRQEIGRLHEEMRNMAVLTEIDRNAIESIRADLTAARELARVQREVLVAIQQEAERATDVNPMPPILAIRNVVRAALTAAPAPVPDARREAETNIIEAARGINHDGPSEDSIAELMEAVDALDVLGSPQEGE